MQKRRIASHLNDNMPSEIHRSQDSINDYYISACYALMPKRQAALEELGNVLKMLAEEHIEKGIPLPQTPPKSSVPSATAREFQAVAPPRFHQNKTNRKSRALDHPDAVLRHPNVSGRNLTEFLRKVRPTVCGCSWSALRALSWRGQHSSLLSRMFNWK